MAELEKDLELGVDEEVDKQTDERIEEVDKKEDLQEVNQEESDLFTQEEVNKIIESRLARERKKYEDKIAEEAERLVDKKLDERQRVSELSEEERKQEALREQEEALKVREAEIEFKERFADTQKTLGERKLSPEFASFLIKDTEDETFENIKAFQKAYEKSVADGIKDALSGKTPKAGTDKVNVLTKEQFDKMTYTEKVKLRKEDTALYNRLIGVNQ